MRRGSWRDELLRAESGVLLQPTAHRVPHPTDMQAPSKINFPFRPCSMFSSGPLLRESLYDSPFGAYSPKEWVYTRGKGKTEDVSCSTTKWGKTNSDIRVVRGGKQAVSFCSPLMCQGWSPGHSGSRGRRNAPLVFSLLTGAFAAWCQRPVVITGLSLSYRYTSVPLALVCQLSSVIRLRAATGQ